MIDFDKVTNDNAGDMFRDFIDKDRFFLFADYTFDFKAGEVLRHSTDLQRADLVIDLTFFKVLKSRYSYSRQLARKYELVDHVIEYYPDVKVYEALCNYYRMPLSEEKISEIKIRSIK